ncbi:MAG: hypothetical protein WA982_00085 [Rubrobacteraceae bacterium]
MGENGEAGKDVGNAESPALFWGRAASGLGIVLAVVGVVAALFGTGASVVPGAVGICLGILGYFLGSNRLGTITIILCTAVLFFGLAASQGLIPGIEASDRSLPDDSPVAD